MPRDPQVETAISHWAPRLLANGVLLTDFEEVTQKIGRWADWCTAWSNRAEVHERLGREAIDAGWFLTSSEHLCRAAACYHFAKFAFVDDLDQMRTAHGKAVECKTLALPYMRPPGVRVQIPYADGSLAGILRRPEGAARPPVVVMISGLDSTKEELETNELPFLQRGMATLTVDGPGQGEAEYAYPIRGDFEVPVKAMVDFILTRSDLDGVRIGLWGVSLGGYYAPRAVAFEKRIRACISLAGPYDLSDNWDGLPSLSREVFRVRSHLSTLDEAKAHAAALTLKNGIAKQIECPLYIVMGKQDRLIRWQDAQRLAHEVSGPVVLQLIEDGNHIANNRPYAYRSRTADWMATQLGLPKR